MKKTLKIMSVVLCMMMVLSCASIVFAGSYDKEFTDAVFGELATFDAASPAASEMRGFTASPDGAYLYGGLLHGGDMGLYKYDAATGKSVAHYIDSDVSFYKGIGADDRGYVYLGVSVPSNMDAVQFIILDSSLKEVYKETIAIAGKVGINGCTVEKVGDKYLMYLVTNYGPNYIYCYDVTDPAAPKLNTAFGDNGIVTLATLTGVATAEAAYLDITKAGDIYMTINLGGGKKGDTLMKLTPDGKSIVMQTAVEEAYGIWVNDDYALVSTYQSADSKVVVLNISDFSKVAEIGNMGDNSNYSGVAIANGKIYVSDQGYNGGDRILVSSKLNIPAVVETPVTPADDEVPTTGSDVATAPDGAAQTSDYAVIVPIILMLSALACGIAVKKVSVK